MGAEFEMWHVLKLLFVAAICGALPTHHGDVEDDGDDDDVDYGGDVIPQVDEGGSKRFLQNMWTSFLKARLVCGIPNDSLYFNRLQDVYVLHAEEWRDSRVYALFTSSW